METVKGDIGYFARALQIHFCGNGLHGKDFFHRFYSSFIEFFLEIWDISTIKCTIVYSGVILYSTRRIEYQRKYEDVLCSVYMKI